MAPPRPLPQARSPLRFPVSLLLLLVASAVSCSAVSSGVFVYDAEHSVAVQAGAPLSASDCQGTSDPAPADAALLSFFASGDEFTVSVNSQEQYSVSPSHPSCLGVAGSWRSMAGGSMLMRQCGDLLLTVVAVDANPAQDVDEGIMITAYYGTGGFCSTHLHKEEAAAAASKAVDWSTWVYAFVGVGISSVVSLIGVSLLLCQRWRLRSFLLELLGLSCGTFLGSIAFVLLPETALEIGMEPKVTAVLLAGIVFGIISETAIHYGAHKLAEAKLHRGAANKAVSPAAGAGSAVQLVAVREAEAPLPAHTLPCDVAGCPVSESVCAANGGACDTAETCTDVAVDVEASVAPACGTAAPAASASADNNASVRLHLDNGAAATGESDVPDLETAAEAAAAAPSPHSPHSLIHSHSRSSSVRNKHDTEKQHHAHDSDDAVDMHAHGHSHGHSHAHATLMDARQAAIINCLADGIHNFIDGALIGSTFLVSPSTGWTTVLAIALHELPQEMADFSLLTNAGWSNGFALLTNLLVSFTAFIGAALAIGIGGQFAFEVLQVLPFAIGLFLYLALAVLVPEMRKASGWQIARVWFAAALGIAMMAVLLATPWGHEHGDEGSSAAGGDSPGHEGHGH